MRVAVLLLFACIGCYNPSYKDCDVTCTNGVCPSGLACNSQQRCVADQATLCGIIDVDAAGPDAIYCGDWAFPVSNVQCPLTKQTGDWHISGNQQLVATSMNPTVPGNPPSVQVINNQIVIVTHDFTIDPGSVLVISPGNDPLMTVLPVIIVASGTAQLDGAIVVSPGRWASSAELGAACGSGTGGGGPPCGNFAGSGGGGGAFGTGAVASRGGACMGGTGGVAGLPNGDSSLVPLRGGCLGGNGAGPPGTPTNPGGSGGLGGGALQISATQLVINSGISVGGGPGLNGPVTSDGGGAGGSGGGLLLETAAGTLGPRAGLCAGGGGGGSETKPGMPGQCGVAIGGMDGFTNGGSGGFGSTPATSGTAGTSTAPGGGGGGGVGRIHLNGHFTIDSSAMITPPQS